MTDSFSDGFSWAKSLPHPVGERVLEAIEGKAFDWRAWFGWKPDRAFMLGASQALGALKSEPNN